MAELDETVARWLVSTDGLAAIALASQQPADDAVALIGFARRTLGLEPEHSRAVVAAAIARRRARDRWPDADRLVFTREGLEQASDPDVAAFRARRYVDRDAVDLCAGVGGDAIALARQARGVTAVDIDPARLLLLAHNARASGVEVAVVVGDALTVRVPTAAAVHADPARRHAGRRARHLDDHVPPVTALLASHAGACGIGVVVAPGAGVPAGAGGDIEVEYLQRGGSLLEATIWRGVLREPGAVASATLLPGGDHRVRRAGPVARLPVGPIGDHLVTVAPAAVRARLHDDLGREIGGRRIAIRRALLTCDTVPPPSPWHLARPVRTVMAARPRTVRAWLRAADAGPVELVLHGLDRDVDAWWRELGRPPRGPGGVRIELTRLDDGAVAIVTDAGRPNG